MALTLQQSAGRADDFTARYGGEEFVLILPGTELEQALHVAEKARQAVERLALPHSASSCADLLALADQALYAAKKGGRNCIRSIKL